ncbi:MAG: S-layer homology domain-containing protein, partial [Anaerolineales bacterium]|nr:S-layer homology domain-containing protein [Anaerolineales bacterium]
MKRKILLSNLSLITALMLAAFWTGQSFASSGCFPDTNGHWAESFICWMKDNSITSGFADGTYKPENGVTRAEMSVFLQKVFNLADTSAQTKANTAETNAKAYADLLVNEPPSTGEIVINSGPNSWEYIENQPGTLKITKSGYSFDVYSTIGNTLANVSITPDFPSVLYGHQLNVTGMEYCYNASPNAYIF